MADERATGDGGSTPGEGTGAGAAAPGKMWELVGRAAELPPAERRAFLDSACGGDPALRAEVESLLAARDRAGGFLAAPTADLKLGPAAAGEQPGTRVGRYKLLQQIGEGGFGVVFMAEQEVPVRRRVALKVIKLGMDTKQVVARFEAERQALALMAHPNIAMVLDAGATDAGRPYFVMELVRGTPIVQYCDQHRLTPGQRLELFVQVCRGVQHAHTKGVIHRDLKPSNVLVAVTDGRPVPKIIDFGIAKATNARLTERTLFTDFNQFIGTPQYMSPEQAGMGGLDDVDTRSDVYSLGVLLYELLTGTTPFDAKGLRCKAYDEVQRIIREVEPPTPSIRINTLGQTLGTVAASRSMDPAQLGRVVRGELDWIVMKALEKDRTRRYETATAIADDVRRHLAGEVVLARPAGTGYRVRKFAGRHKAAVAAVGAVVAALLLGVAATGVGLAGAQRAEARAVQAEARAVAERDDAVQARRAAEAARAAESRQRQVAETAREHTKAANEFLQGMLTSLMAGEQSARQTLDASAAKVDGGWLGDQPETEATVRTTLGQGFLKLEAWDEANRHLRHALEIRRRLHGPDHPDVARSHLLVSLALQQRGDRAAEAALQESLAQCRRSLSPDHPAIAVALDALAAVRKAKDDRAGAESFRRQATELWVQHFSRRLDAAPADPDLIASRGRAYGQLGRFDRAREDFSRAKALRPEDHQNWNADTYLRLYLGDVAGYRTNCHDMVARFGPASSAEVCDRVAKACLAAEHSLEDLRPVERLVERALASGANPGYYRWFHLCKGMLEYRLGRAGQAVVWLTRARNTMEYPLGEVEAELFLALSQHRLGEATAARESLRRATDRMDRELPSQQTGVIDGMEDWLICQVVRREAEATINGGGGLPGPTTQQSPTSQRSQ